MLLNQALTIFRLSSLKEVRVLILSDKIPIYNYSNYYLDVFFSVFNTHCNRLAIVYMVKFQITMCFVFCLCFSK